MAATDPYERAMALMTASRHAEAIPLFDAAIAREPTRARIYSNRGQSLQQLGEREQARASVARGVELRGDDAYPLLLAARVTLAHDDLTAARGYAEAAWAARAHVDPELAAEAVEIAAYCLNTEGGWRAALRLLDEALGVFADNATLIGTRASTLASGDRWGEGAREIARALALAPEDAGLVKRAQTIARGLAVVAAGLVTARAEAQASPTSWEAWHGLGVALWMTGDPLDASAAFARARKLHPDPTYRRGDSSALSTWEVDCKLATLATGSPSPAR